MDKCLPKIKGRVFATSHQEALKKIAEHLKKDQRIEDVKIGRRFGYEGIGQAWGFDKECVKVTYMDGSVMGFFCAETDMITIQ